MNEIKYFASRHGGIDIAWRCFRAPNERAAALFLEGRGDCFMKYTDFYSQLNGLGITVFAIDHRGQGASGRMLPEKEKDYIETYDFFVDDAEDMLRNVVLKEVCGIPVFLISYSMGGTISLLLAPRIQDIIKKAVFITPMCGLNYGKLPEFAAEMLVKGACFLGFGKNYAFGKSALDHQKPFEKKCVTHDREKYEMQREFFRRHPNIALGGPTFKWVLESMKAIKKLENAAPLIDIPVLLFQAGADVKVDNKKQDKIASLLKNCRKVIIPGAMHELLSEEKSYYDRTFGEISEFLSDRQH